MNILKRSLGGVVMSMVELLVGILLLVNPVGFTSAIIVVCGIVLMLCGVGSIVKYFRTAPEEAAIRRGLSTGLVELLGGAFCAFNSQWFIVAFPVLTLAYGVVILLIGLTKVQWMVDMIRMKHNWWFLAAISAAVSILCGIVIITSPFSTMTVLWMFIGISLIVEAVFDLVAAFFGHREKRDPIAEI